MCQYFWWKCETCSATQDYALICQIGINHNPCQQSKPSTLLPLIDPPPACQYCGQIRGGGGPFSLTQPLNQNQLKPHAEIMHVLKAVSDDELFWMDPSLRLPNFQQTLDRYDCARNKIFEDAEQRKLEPGTAKTAVSEEVSHKRGNQDLKDAWQRLRDSLTGRCNVSGGGNASSWCG